MPEALHNVALTSRNAASAEKCLCKIEHLAATLLEKLLPQTNKF
jgi:hypothetical protein